MLLNKIFIKFINLYQRLPFRSVSSCRFYPTCSDYGLNIFSKHKFFCAIKLLFMRLKKCHPYTENIVDNPPEVGCGSCICSVK